MSIKRVLNNKEAISTTISTLLLVFVAVASIVVTYVWVTTYLSNTTQQAEVLLNEENVRFDTTTTVIITVGNQGTGNTVITKIYLGTLSTDMQDVTANSTISGSGALAAGSICTVTITLPTAGVSTWTSGTTYYFRIIPIPGQFLEFQQVYA